jgi:hypothetical protein
MAGAMKAAPPEDAAALEVAHPPATATAEQTPQPQSTPAPQIAVVPWPDALSRQHKAAPNSEAASAPAPVNNPSPQTPESAQGQAALQSVTVDTALKPATGQSVKRRVAIKRSPAADERASDASSNDSRRLYDSYGRQDYSRQQDYDHHDDENADRDSDRGGADARIRASRYSSTKSSKSRTKPQSDAHRQPPVEVEQSSERADGRLYDRSDDRSDEGDRGDGMPAQPPPLPFFGLFGGGDRD